MQGESDRSLRHALASALRAAPVRRRALITAALVGTLLTLINQGDALIEGRIDLLKAALSYCVPFCVAIYSAAQAMARH